MDAGFAGHFYRVPGAFNIFFLGPRQGRDNRTADFSRHFLYPREIALRRNGEAGLDDVYTERVELASQQQLFLEVHAASATLLSVAQRGIEDNYALAFHPVLLHFCS